MVDPAADPLELVPSRFEQWTECYVAERGRIIDVLTDQSLDDALRRIEHVGSSAVPGLAAKDIVDLDVVVADDRVAEVARALATELGGSHVENSAEWHPVFRDHDGQRFNDHVFAASADGWKVSVVTRDVLRARRGLREEYADLKRDLAAASDDLYTYSTGKTEFLDRMLAIARRCDDLSYPFPIPSVTS